ncbi:membrane-spanning 4-domains subfamily A member 8-like isoform X4 [Phyllostomus hastatus]|nr:membrane-spanning 4-domains subfamily A member 8-like isoform X4 [Phyllostomus hastatus]XP_045711135.1 membrane-spanning 4-domains subfamily A member 8-like isoform X4 [Phyllostomus hastatus]XP_045711136.1 membrane-spanning 4-domains subfamily A member 8-like isoform X4 [Phyllostomus hastatus]
MSAGPSVYIVVREQPSPDHWYSLNPSQILHITRNHPVLVSAQDQRTLKEGKTLGALQLLIGVIYISLGGIMDTIKMTGNYIAPSFTGGVPFWGGISFIISGSFSVASELLPNSLYLLRTYIIVHIFSAITSVIGMSLFIAEIIINSPYIHLYMEVFFGRTTSGILLSFSILEFWIAFACTILGYRHNKSLVEAQNSSEANQVDTEQPGNSH